MKNIYAIILFLFVFLNFNILFAELELTPELKDGKEKAATICSACHGMDGKAESGGNSGAVPNLTAQDKNYLIIKLLEYKSGKLQHPQMTLIAKMLTDEDIKNVSEWYSRIKIEIIDPNIALADPY
jgi:cytochrome c553